MTKQTTLSDLENAICDLKHASVLLIDIFASEPDVLKSIAKMDLIFRLIEERADELYNLYQDCCETSYEKVRLVQ